MAKQIKGKTYNVFVVILIIVGLVLVFRELVFVQ